MNAAVMQDSLLTSVLVLSDVNLENAGAYTCTANNTARRVVNDDTSYLTVASKYAYIDVHVHGHVCTMYVHVHVLVHVKVGIISWRRGITRHIL